jgi:branched-chain amino acid transport system substrate-binding protein
MKSHRLFNSVAIVLIVLGVSASVTAGAQEKAFTIGCSLPLSGPLVGFGEPIKAGIDVATKEMNEAMKSRGAKFTLQCFDSKGDAKETINIAQRLIDQRDVIASISDFTTTATMAAAETYRNGELVQMTPTASHPDLTKTNSWMFRASLTIPTYIDPTADVIVDKLGQKRVSVVQVQTDWGASVGKIFDAEFKTRGGEIVSHEIYNQGQTDFRSILTQIKRQNPDVIFTAMLEEEFVNFLKQKAQFGMQQQVVDSSVGVTPRSIELGGSAMNGVISMTLFSEKLDNPVAREFARRYRELTGGKSPDIWGAYGYDAGRLIIEAAMRAFPNVTRAAVRDQLAQTKDYHGANGVLSIDPATREVVRQVPSFVRVTDGKLDLMK